MNYGRFEQRVFATATASLVAEPVDAVRVERFLADIAARAPFAVRWGLRALLWLTWLMFLGADGAGRVRRWESALAHPSSTVRQLALAVKAMACLCHFDR